MNHSISNSVESAGKEIAQAFIRARMSANFEDMARKELSDLHGSMVNEGKHIEAAAVASAISTLEARNATLNSITRDDSTQALYALSNSATRTASQYIDRISHGTDEPALYIYLKSGMQITASCTRYDVGLFNVRWGPQGCTRDSNLAFNIDAAAVLSIISR